jgi:hypothetical protein
MTTAKTENKGHVSESEEAPRQADLRVAYEIHTLAQMMYGEMARAHPWVTPPSPLVSFEATQNRSPFMATGAGPNTSIPTHWPW